MKSGPAGHGCLKKGPTCGVAKNPGFDGYRKVSTPATKDLAAAGVQIGFEFHELGFTANTRVRVRDLFLKRDVGIFSGSYRTSTPVPAHGVRLLKITYEPAYQKGEL